MNNFYSSAQASSMIGTSSRNSLTVYLSRHPELRPAMQLPSGDYVWTLQEIEAVRARKAAHGRGRPSKK